MSFVLDTSALSDLMGGDESTLSRLRAVRRADVFLPQPVLAEVAYGLARLGKTKRGLVLRERFNLFCGELKRAPWSDDVSLEFASLKVALERSGKPNEDFDLAIAAHAIHLHATLVTRNTRHYARIPGLALEDWSIPVGAHE